MTEPLVTLAQVAEWEADPTEAFDVGDVRALCASYRRVLEALEPLAAMAKEWPHSMADWAVVIEPESSHKYLTLSHFRRAAELVREAKVKP